MSKKEIDIGNFQVVVDSDGHGNHSIHSPDIAVSIGGVAIHPGVSARIVGESAGRFENAERAVSINIVIPIGGGGGGFGEELYSHIEK